MQNQLILLTLLISLLLSACSGMPKQGNNEVALPASSEAHILPPTDTPILQASNAIPTPFGSGRAIWNNDGDVGVLYDTQGQPISEQVVSQFLIRYPIEPSQFAVSFISGDH
jgi:hypothetical protein